MRPRTMASAFASVASRSPIRPSSASRTASVTSCVSAGSGVSLSNGRIATVLTLGSVPPWKPYGHALSDRLAALMATAPSVRRNDRRSIDHADGELKSGRTLRKVDARACRVLEGIEPGAALRQHLAAPAPLRLQQGLAARAVRHHVIERIVALREAPDHAPPVRH